MQNKVVVIGAASTVILDPEPTRKRVILCNNSDEDMYIGVGFPAVSTWGIPLRKNGGAWVDEADATGYIFKGAYNGICASGSKNLSVVELT